MKKLVVYYSYTGNTRKIASIIKEKLNCDVLEIINSFLIKILINNYL